MDYLKELFLSSDEAATAMYLCAVNVTIVAVMSSIDMGFRVWDAINSKDQ